MPRVAPPTTLHLPKQDLRTAETVAARLVRMIGAGRLAPGDRLPSTRALSQASGVPRSRIVAAYELLGAGGFVRIKAGSGAVVAADAAAAESAAGAPRRSTGTSTVKRTAAGGQRPRFNLMPGAPDTSLIDRRDWRRAWRVASREVPEVDRYRPNEHPELVTALRHHLRQVRGVVADEADIVVFPGVTAALTAVLDAMAGAMPLTRAAMEDPGYSWARAPLQDSGVDLELIEVDDQGLRVELLRPTHQLVYVTPAHQYPLGARMPVGRRHDLLQWAREHQAIVIEDDFDGEFRHDAAPLGPLRAMTGADESVVYIGTASKTLTPQLRLAWAVLPPQLSAAVRDAARRRRSDSCGVTARALASFIESGAMARHLARTQRTYAARRRRLVAALEEQLPQLRISGADSGMHLAARWNDGPVDTDVVAGLGRRGLMTSALSTYGIRHRPNGLLLGYAQLPETAAAAAVGEISRVLGQSGG